MRLVKRLERSIALDVIPSFFIGTALYIAIFLVQRVLAQPYLSALPVSSFAPWLIYQIPAFALQAFPIAAVFAVLLTFGRLARDNELLAASAGGISLPMAVRSVLIFGALVAVAGFVIAEYVAPRANELVAKTWWQGVSVSKNALERVIGKSIALDGSRNMFIGGVDGQELTNVRLESWAGNTATIYFGKRARFTGKALVLIGYRGFSVNYDEFPAPENDPNWVSRAVPLSNVPFKADAKLTFTLSQSADRVVADNAASGFEDPRRLSELWDAYHRNGERGAGVQFGLKTAQPLASFVILLFGIPIASRGARSSGVAFGLAVVIAVGFFLALYLGRTLSEIGILPALLGPWLVNIGFLIAGAWLFRSRAM
jgi:lipopolysaccharide export system permease protein